MKQWEYIEHTADAEFKAYGKTIEEAFGNAALAMFNILTNVKKVEPKIKKKIKKRAPRLDTLLYEFLNGLLFFLDTEGFIVSEVKNLVIKKGKECELSAIVNGDVAENYEVHGDIKSATYNNMQIKEENGIFVLRVVVDI